MSTPDDIPEHPPSPTPQLSWGDYVSGLINAIAGLVPVWTRTAESVDTLAQTMAQPKPAKLDIEKPKEFNGEPEKVDSFIRSCTFYFKGKHISDEDQMINFALSKIKDGKGNIAENWRDLAYQEIEAHEDDPAMNKPPFYDWKEFVEKFKTYFKPVHNRDVAQKELAKLSQGTLPAEVYVNSF